MGNSTSSNTLKTSAEWHEAQGNNPTILDPDGWDRSNYQFSFHEELITEPEFMQRLARSTVSFKK